MNQHAGKKAARPPWAQMSAVSRRGSSAIFWKFSVKVIRLAEAPQFRNFTPKTVCCACRPALSSVTTHWTSSPATCERRIPIMFIRLVARPRLCTIRDAWRGARGRKAKRPSIPVWISSSHGTARSRRFMFISTRRPHNLRNGTSVARSMAVRHRSSTTSRRGREQQISASRFMAGPAAQGRHETSCWPPSMSYVAPVSAVLLIM